MFLHIRQFLSNLEFLSKSSFHLASFWLQKWIQIVSQSSKNRHRSLIEFFASIFFGLHPFWEAFGKPLATILGPKQSNPVLVLAVQLPLGIFFTLHASQRSHLKPKNHPKSLSIDKNRYETTLGASIYRYLWVRRPLTKPQLRGLFWPIFTIHVES